MDGQERACAICGRIYNEGDNFCSNCGVSLVPREETEESVQESEAQAEQSESAPVIKPKRKTYKARRIVSLCFAIADIFLAIPFWICGVIFEKVSILIYYDKSLYDVSSSEYKLSEISDIYYVLAGVGYALAVLFAVGFAVSLLMFFIYLKKGRDAKRALEAQKDQEPQNEEQAKEEKNEEIEEKLEEAEAFCQPTENQEI